MRTHTTTRVLPRDNCTHGHLSCGATRLHDLVRRDPHKQSVQTPYQSCHSFLVTSSGYQHEYTCIYRPLPSYHVHHVLSSESQHSPGQQFFGPRKSGHRSCNLTYQSAICATLTTAEATPLSSSLPATSRVAPASNGCAHTWATAHTQGGKGGMGAPRVLYTQLLEPIQTGIRGIVCSVLHQWVV